MYQSELFNRAMGILGDSPIKHEMYYITEGDGQFQNTFYQCPKGVVLYFSTQSQFAMYNEEYEGARDIFVDVKIGRRPLGIFVPYHSLVKGYYSEMREFKNVDTIYSLHTEYLLKPGEYIHFPKCDYFMLTCQRFMRMAD